MAEAGITFGDAAQVIGLFIVVAGGGWAIWWRIEGRVEKAKQAAYRQSDAALTKADAAAGLASLAREELANYKTHVAETYISKAGHRESNEQIMSAITGVRSAIDANNQRIDRLFDEKPRGGVQS